MPDLFFEDLGVKSNLPLLYLHGGPGTGSYDFTLHQEKLLTDEIRLISLDQRGVLRSEPIGKDNNLGLNDLVEDIEMIRRQLNVQRWSVLGHSFGGYLALKYAMIYPDNVEKLIFENASFDLGSSARSLLNRAAMEYAANGDSTKSGECLRAAFSPGHSAAEIWEKFSRLTNAMGPERDNLYFHGLPADYFERLVEDSPFPKEYWTRGQKQQKKLFEEGEIFNSLLKEPDDLPENKTLLIRGMYDSVLSNDQLHTYLEARPASELSVFRNSSHFPHMEEAQAFALKVKKFVFSD